MKNGKYSNSKKGSRAIVLLMALMLLVGSAIGGTLAWLISTADPVTDTFTYGEVTIQLYEGETTKDWNNTKRAENEEKRETEHKLIPGDEITFDPRVEVAAESEECWLFVKVAPAANAPTYLTQDKITDGWTALSDVDHVYYRTVSDTNEDQRFQIIKEGKYSIPSTITNADLASLKGNAPTVIIAAYAIQKENSGDTAAEAWTAMNAQINGN